MSGKRPNALKDAARDSQVTGAGVGIFDRPLPPVPTQQIPLPNPLQKPQLPMQSEKTESIVPPFQPREEVKGHPFQPPEKAKNRPFQAPEEAKDSLIRPREEAKSYQEEMDLMKTWLRESRADLEDVMKAVKRIEDEQKVRFAEITRALQLLLSDK